MSVEKTTPAVAAKITQDPPRASDRSENSLEMAIGRELRGFRRKQEVTVAELANRTGLSIGMLSKIENGNTSPSLKTLQTLATALSLPITSFFRRFDGRRDAIHTKSGEGITTEAADRRACHQTHLLGHIGAPSSGVIAKPYLVTLSQEADDVPTSQHGGTETIYMLEGAMDYRHGDKLYRLTAGDSLQFDADCPHGPTAAADLPARYLSIVSASQNS
ncbi:XRE family transcriptional regulator [uncultured Planktomarina sp.]|jgi:transcriptional regulator with XRE-family HTH domain|uniref:helix-turn-helix domain-containing protein n=1 Tax=uncultured Planktomarina sp. TaxID=1538529 RepID=UPI00326194F1